METSTLRKVKIILFIVLIFTALTVVADKGKIHKLEAKNNYYSEQIKLLHGALTESIEVNNKCSRAFGYDIVIEEPMELEKILLEE